MKPFLLSAAYHVLSSPIGTAFFKLTKKRFRNDRTSKYGNIWWYGYLLNFARHHDLKRISANNKGYRAVRKILTNYDFFRFYNTVYHQDCISHILYELSQGYIPVFDDRFHVWTQFYKQPVQIEGREIGELSKLPASDETNVLYTPTMVPYCKPVRKLWSKLLKEFCTLNETEAQYIDNEIRTILGNQRVLGVLCRGTDYIGTGMAKQPDGKDVITEAKQWMEKYHYDKIYLATEVEAYYLQFEEALPGRILVNKRSYYEKAMVEQNVNAIGRVHFDRENDDYLKGLEYLSSLYILSRCQALLGGYCGGTNMALLLNDSRYERFKVYSL